VLCTLQHKNLFKKLSEGKTIEFDSDGIENHKTVYFPNLTVKEISWPVFLDKLGKNFKHNDSNSLLIVTLLIAVKQSVVSSYSTKIYSRKCLKVKQSILVSMRITKQFTTLI
jgi:hypothetical protein